jgi:hypothetical protein
VEAGYALGANYPTFAGHPTRFLTNNMGIARYTLHDPATALKIERIINEYGLEHLIQVFPLKNLDFDE